MTEHKIIINNSIQTKNKDQVKINCSKNYIKQNALSSDAVAGYDSLMCAKNNNFHSFINCVNTHLNCYFFYKIDIMIS